MTLQRETDLSTELRRIDGLGALPEGVLARLVEASSQRRIEAGVTLVEEGAVSGSLMFVLRGAFKTERRRGDGGRSAVLDVARGPRAVVDTSTLDGRPAEASVVTLRACLVATVDRAVFRPMVEAHPELLKALLGWLTSELRLRAERLDARTAGSAEARIRRLLDDLAAAYGSPIGEGRFIGIPFRRHDMASMVEVTPETASRVLARFERDGLVRSSRDGLWWRSVKHNVATDSVDALANSKASRTAAPPSVVASEPVAPER
jgi:CRP/FNR family transcriptional regulator